MRKMFSEKQLQEQVKNQLAEGNVNDVKIFEDIVDNDGHKRFIEGEINFETAEGFSKVYAKWSLSGTHLLIVVCGSVANTTAFTEFTLAKVNLPSWILDKIYPIYNKIVVPYTSFKAYAANGTNQDLNVRAIKEDSTLKLQLYNATMTADRNFRFQIDLLIDNE